VILCVLAAGVLGSGCATNGRRVLLKEYSASIPAQADSALRGVTVCLKGFTSAQNLVSLEPTMPPEEPTPFTYTDRTREQDKLWDGEQRAYRKKTTKADWREIGNLRNGFGIVMSHAYAMNDPAEWLVQSMKYDLEAQGAKVVDAAQASTADVSITGTILLFRADMYFVINGNMLVDLEIQAKQGPARHKQIHTHGATGVAMASEGEYFHALRDARQKFSVIAIREITQAIK
jgi:hypothetical protein